MTYVDMRLKVLRRHSLHVENNKSNLRVARAPTHAFRITNQSTKDVFDPHVPFRRCLWQKPKLLCEDPMEAPEPGLERVTS